MLVPASTWAVHPGTKQGARGFISHHSPLGRVAFYPHFTKEDIKAESERVGAAQHQVGRVFIQHMLAVSHIQHVLDDHLRGGTGSHGSALCCVTPPTLTPVPKPQTQPEVGLGRVAGPTRVGVPGAEILQGKLKRRTELGLTPPKPDTPPAQAASPSHFQSGSTH